MLIIILGFGKHCSYHLQGECVITAVEEVPLPPSRKLAVVV
jgi:hypothetical protein